MSSTFSINTELLNNTEFTGQLDTAIIPVDEGEYTLVCEKYIIKAGESNNNGEKKPYVNLEVHWIVDDEEQRQKTQREKIIVRQSVFLDLTPTGGLDMGKGKNVQLGRLREALGQNSPTKSWRFGDIVGGMVKGMVVQRLLDDGTIVNDVKKVAPF